MDIAAEEIYVWALQGHEKTLGPDTKLDFTAKPRIFLGITTFYLVK